jgi:hypothetical protein
MYSFSSLTDHLQVITSCKMHSGTYLRPKSLKHQSMHLPLQATRPKPVVMPKLSNLPCAPSWMFPGPTSPPKHPHCRLILLHSYALLSRTLPSLSRIKLAMPNRVSAMSRKVSSPVIAMRWVEKNCLRKSRNVDRTRRSSGRAAWTPSRMLVQLSSPLASPPQSLPWRLTKEQRRVCNLHILR